MNTSLGWIKLYRCFIRRCGLSEVGVFSPVGDAAAVSQAQRTRVHLQQRNPQSHPRPTHHRPQKTIPPDRHPTNNHPTNPEMV